MSLVDPLKDQRRGDHGSAMTIRGLPREIDEEETDSFSRSKTQATNSEILLYD
ncbi:MAG TPA: hypothetical protein VFI73_04570 [Candidatus Nitrosopolaris sp.]|nr:hypothetical protein [Candidatus Nitrosopolaris sp.]